MDGDNRPKRKVRTGLIKLFRDALDEALETDPVQHIRDGYHNKLDSEYNPETGADKDGIKENIGILEARRDEPFRHIRDTFDKILDNEYTGPAAEQEAPRQRKNNFAGSDPFQRVREAYGQMLDERENKYQADQAQKNEQRPWWKKLF